MWVVDIDSKVVAAAEPIQIFTLDDNGDIKSINFPAEDGRYWNSCFGTKGVQCSESFPNSAVIQRYITDHQSQPCNTLHFKLYRPSPRKSALLDDAGSSEEACFSPFIFFPSPRERTVKTRAINRYRVQSRSDWDKDNGEAQTQTQTQRHRQTRGDRW